MEASAGQSKFVQRAAKSTGKVLLAVATLGRWRAPKPTVAQRAAPAAPLDVPVDLTPDAVPHRRTERAGAGVRAWRPTACAQLEPGATVCDDGLFAPFGCGPSADRPGFELPESLQEQGPGSGGSGSQAGAQLQLVWEDKSQTVAHFALVPGRVPANAAVAPGGDLARPHARGGLALGSFKLTAWAKRAAAPAYLLPRRNPHPPRWEGGGGRRQPRAFPSRLAPEPRAGLEQARVRGTRAPGAARGLAVRRPAALGKDRRRQARAGAKQRGATPAQAQLTLWAWPLFLPQVPATVWAPQPIGGASAFRWQVDRGGKAWKSGLP
jgi:hypothetical protein